MLKLRNLTIEAAIANYSEAMESRYHFKNGVNPKNQRSRGDIIILILFYLAAIIAASSLLFVSCLQNNAPYQLEEKTFTLNAFGLKGEIDTKHGIFFYGLGTHFFTIEPTFASGQTRLLALHEDDYNAILSKDVLMAVYNEAPESNKVMTIKRHSVNFQPAYFITKVGDEIYLIKWNDVTVNNTANVGTATFTVKM